MRDRFEKIAKKVIKFVSLRYNYGEEWNFQAEGGQYGT